MWIHKSIGIGHSGIDFIIESIHEEQETRQETL